MFISSLSHRQDKQDKKATTIFSPTKTGPIYDKGMSEYINE